MNALCLLVSGGEYAELPDALTCADYVIACDRGWLYADRLGLVPDLVIGDFDSAPPPGEENIAVERVPTQKDDTDTMLAARRAIELGFRKIGICCAFGGRLDHTMANIQTAVWLASRGAHVHLAGKDCEAVVIRGNTERLPRREGWSLSVFALTDTCSGVSIRGTKYECDDIQMTSHFPLGISNTWSSGEAVVSVREGILMIMLSRLQDAEHI